MPRRPRTHLPGGMFHITARGVDGSSIFLDDHDRRCFVLHLEQTTNLWGWCVIAWCLMGTHYHLVVAAQCEQMSLAVHRLNCLYAMYFNRRYDRRGHLSRTGTRRGSSRTRSISRRRSSMCSTTP